jgi:hypothetical protein
MRLLSILAVGALALPTAATASELIARNAKSVHLEVSRNGQQALLSYTANGRTWYVLASGAINAVAPAQGRKQVTFTLRRSISRPAFKGSCGHYRAKVPFLVTACSAGTSYWAVQEWQRALPNFGAAPSAFAAQPELRLSHWAGPIASLMLKSDWSYGGKWQHVYGYLSYRGNGVHGFSSTNAGVPTDSFGRNIYLDTLDSPYGTGWQRENSFLAHNPTGAFCYDLSPHRSGLTGQGAMYRATVIGPGVTPDVSKTVPAPGPYDAQKDAVANQEQLSLFPDDHLCRPS